jgi:hypothetical protein
MAKQNVLVEICLTSNDSILGVSGERHPLREYMKYDVPVALATDDEGVSRSDMTHEYLRAVEDQGLKYADLKRMARASLEHSFVPGDSLWSDGKEFRRTAACEKDNAWEGGLSERCQKFVQTSEKARLQWNLEKAFANFEKVSNKF